LSERKDLIPEDVDLKVAFAFVSRAEYAYVGMRAGVDSVGDVRMAASSLPTPLGPSNRYADATRPCLRA
jgi:hypothetical protein